MARMVWEPPMDMQIWSGRLKWSARFLPEMVWEPLKWPEMVWEALRNGLGSSSMARDGLGDGPGPGGPGTARGP